MILEAIAYLKERRHSPKEHWGFVHQLVALQFRYQRNKNLWHSHLVKCHQIIDEAIQLAGAEEIVVLGSGLGLEFPLANLLKAGKKLVLVDLVFPSELKDLAKMNPRQITLLKRDLTGGIQLADLSNSTNFVEKSRNAISDLPRGFVISCNVLSQLPLMKLVFSEKHSIEENRALQFAELICDAHLQSLKKHFDNGLVISDFVRKEVHKRVSKELLNTLPVKLHFQHQWEWQLECSRNHQINLVVGAVSLRSL